MSSSSKGARLSISTPHRSLAQFNRAFGDAAALRLTDQHGNRYLEPTPDAARRLREQNPNLWREVDLVLEVAYADDRSGFLYCGRVVRFNKLQEDAAADVAFWARDHEVVVNFGRLNSPAALVAFRRLP